eukprot:1970844-Rhodomonas_salina.1
MPSTLPQKRMAFSSGSTTARCQYHRAGMLLRANGAHIQRLHVTVTCVPAKREKIACAVAFCTRAAGKSIRLRAGVLYQGARRPTDG